MCLQVDDSTRWDRRKESNEALKSFIKQSVRQHPRLHCLKRKDDVFNAPGCWERERERERRRWNMNFLNSSKELTSGTDWCFWLNSQLLVKFLKMHVEKDTLETNPPLTDIFSGYVSQWNIFSIKVLDSRKIDVLVYCWIFFITTLDLDILID